MLGHPWVGISNKAPVYEEEFMSYIHYLFDEFIAMLSFANLNTIYTLGEKMNDSFLLGILGVIFFLSTL